MERILKITSDGSHTLYVPELNEHYHSIHGAVQESNHVFIEAGLKVVDSGQWTVGRKRTIRVFEVGLGTGLNALLTYLEAKKQGIKIEYTAIEAFPLEKEIYTALNFSSVITGENVDAILNLIHTSAWNTPVELSPDYVLVKRHDALENIVLETDKYDLVYFDAFAPEVQPELWTEDIFRKIYNAMANGGILVTYCCKGDVKRAMKAAGFTIEKLHGPPGKREMLRGKKF